MPPLTDRVADNFTPRAKRALHLAEEEAVRLGHASLGTQHLLLGLVREGEGIAAGVLTRHGVDLERTRAAVAAAGAPARDGGQACEQIIARAQQDALNFGHTYLGTEHLLLALLHEDNGAALAVLRGLGADSGAMDAEVRVVISLAPGTYVVKGPKDNVVTCRVDDAALNAIDALVEAGIRSTRSDAAAWLISSGIEANREFFVQVHSTVAEIRRLREKAQALARSGPDTAPAAANARPGRARRAAPRAG
jgi:ATP-dependent Clp protease ATP-binding subunit ClpC